MPEQGTSYGPAFSRVTRTPIIFDNASGNAGLYTHPSLLADMVANIPIIKNFINQTGTIHINPENIGTRDNLDNTDVGTVTRHEQIHQLLHKLYESNKLEGMNRKNPYYNSIVNSLNPNIKVYMQGQGGAGDPQAELPAYTATKESSRLSIPQPLAQDYVNYLQDQLFKIDPNLAKKFQQLRSK
jgi:hypothetical protein